MSSRLKKAALGLALIAVAAGLAYYVIGRSGAPEQKLYGTVEVRQVDLAFPVEGRLEDLLVEEGDTVTTGQMLARLEKGYLKDAVAIATARVAAQQQTLDKLRAGPRPQEIAEAESNVAAAQADLVNARQSFDRQQDLVKKNAAPERNLDEARAARDMADARLSAARHRLSLLRAGSREEDIAAAEAQLKAEQALKNLAERRLDDADLEAPADGVIMSRVREPGAVLAPGTTVLTMAKTRPVWVRAYVPEPRLGSVAPGTPVDVFTDSRPGEPYAGRVGYVAPVAEFTPKAVQTEELRSDLVFRFHVVIDTPDSLLRQGMPVTVRLR